MSNVVELPPPAVAVDDLVAAVLKKLIVAAAIDGRLSSDEARGMIVELGLLHT